MNTHVRDLSTVTGPDAQRMAVGPSGVDLSAYPVSCACEREDEDGFDVRFYPTWNEAMRQANAWPTAIWIHADGSDEVL